MTDHPAAPAPAAPAPAAPAPAATSEEWFRRRDYYLETSKQFYLSGALKEAENVARTALLEQPGDPYIEANLATILSRQGVADETDRLFRSSISKRPKETVAVISYYNFLIRQKRANWAIGLMEFWANKADIVWRRSDDAPCDAPDQASEHQPSAIYLETLRQYALLHATKDESSDLGTFDGVNSFGRWAGMMRPFVAEIGARSLLDYGGGKGVQYELKDIVDAKGGRHADMRAFLGLDHAICYDPGYRQDAPSPGDDCADLVVSVDVLEHAPVDDLRWIVRRLFASARKGVFVVVANYPAGKFLPDGRNAHITLRPGDWWARLFRDCAVVKPQIPWRLISYDHWSDGGRYFASEA